MPERIFLSPPHMSGRELDFVREAFASNYIAPLGPQVDAFEREFCERVGVRRCLALSSGTAAMHLALRHFGVGPGDEVFASTLTFIGSVSPVTFLGGTPVFIDSARGTWNMDPDRLAEELARRRERGRPPKAVIPTDIYGQCADYQRIFAICEPHGIPVIVDAAEAPGAHYEWDGEGGEKQIRHAGVGAAAAIYSFNGNKILTTSGGGMLASDDKTLIDRARFFSQQARDPEPHYQHSEIGFNYRMSNILAAIGRGQLTVLEERVKRKREIFETYRQALETLPGVEFMPEAPYGASSRWLTVILITPEAFGANRESVRLALEMENIESRPVWKPMHMQPAFEIDGRPGEAEHNGKTGYPARAVGGEIAEDLFDRGLCLPSGTALTESDLDRVIAVIRRCARN